MLFRSDAIAAIPDDVVIVEWGYEADHAFDARCGRLRAAGRTCWVAPGTSGWSAIGARVATMRANVDAALDAAARHGASGLLMTSWGTNPSVSDWPGFVWAAAGAWNRQRRPDLGAALDLAVVAVQRVDHDDLHEVIVAVRGVHADRLADAMWSAG